MAKHTKTHGSVVTYTLGFGLSIVMTLAAFATVVYHILPKSGTLFIVCLAVGQLLVQLLCFLHLGSEARPRWNLLIFLLAVLIIAIIVGGSLWIMANLNYNMMPPLDMQGQVMDQGAF
jgi:cytochrome o ubiquinol oxidase operon protein cyoD